MEKSSVKCALLATMRAKHKWGTPITEEAILNLSAIDGDYPTARDVYADLRSEPYREYRRELTTSVVGGGQEGIEEHDWK